MDLLVVPTIGFRLLYAFVVLHHDRRRIFSVAVTSHPTAEWVARQIAKAFASWARFNASITSPCSAKAICAKFSNSTRITTTAYELTSFGQRRANHHIGQIVAIQCSGASIALTFRT
jgi:hypothetical protein